MIHRWSVTAATSGSRLCTTGSTKLLSCSRTKSIFSSKTQCPHSSMTPPSAEIGGRLCRVEAMISERSMTSPSQHRHSQRVYGQFSSLRGHLRNVAAVVQARAEAAWLPHMHDVLLYFTLGYRRRVIGEIAEEVPQVLLLPALDKQSGDVHVYVHPQMPIGNSRIDASGVVQSERRCLERGK